MRGARVPGLIEWPAKNSPAARQRREHGHQRHASDALRARRPAAPQADPRRHQSQAAARRQHDGTPAPDRVSGTTGLVAIPNAKPYIDPELQKGNDAAGETRPRRRDPQFPELPPSRDSRERLRAVPARSSTTASSSLSTAPPDRRRSCSTCAVIQPRKTTSSQPTPLRPGKLEQQLRAWQQSVPREPDRRRLQVAGSNAEDVTRDFVRRFVQGRRELTVVARLDKCPPYKNEAARSQAPLGHPRHPRKLRD